MDQFARKANGCYLEFGLAPIVVMYNRGYKSIAKR